MNQRIRELAHEVGLPTYNPKGIPTKLEKFAELIVQECCQMMLDLEIKYPANLTVQEIKQHFGVEE